jgi:hypothetical protein
MLKPTRRRKASTCKSSGADHVSHGVMNLKKLEFKDLKQGSLTVSEYMTHFTQLSHCALDNMDIDEKKQDFSPN